MDIQEIHLRSRRVLPDNQPPSPPEELEEENEENVPKPNPPHFPQILIHPNQHTLEEIEHLGELKNLCVKIPLFQTIEDVPIYNKVIKEKCFKHPRRIKKYTPTINVIGQLSDLILGRVIFPKYLDHGSLVVDVYIDDIIFPHTLIDLGASINVMTKDNMLRLNLEVSLRKTTTILQLGNKSTISFE